MTVFYRIKNFCEKYPWSVAFLILFIAMGVGFFRVDQIADQRTEDLVERRVETLKRDKQFCTAIPNVAEASAQALVNILIANAKRRGDTREEIQRITDLGHLYTDESRRLALEDLPECPKLLALP